MKKNDFLEALRTKLSDLPKKDVDECIGFYSEMIDDRIEAGLTESDAVSDIGSLEDIIAQITCADDSAKPKHKKKKRATAGTILLLTLGSPLWISLLLAAFSVLLSLYVSLWSVIVSLWAAFVSLVGGAVGGAFAGVVLCLTGSVPTGALLIGAAFAAAGLSVFAFFGCKEATKGSIALTKLIVRGVVRKRGNKE